MGIPYIYTATAGDYPIKRDDIKCFNGEAQFTRPEMDAKRYKILPHLYCPSHDITIWCDANIYVMVDAHELVRKCLGDGDMALFSHPYRRTVWEEFETLRVEERFQIPWLQQQLSQQAAHYHREGLPDETPLYECNLLIRRRNERVNRLMDAWWAEICRWQWRDQVSFPYVLWKYGRGLKIYTIPGPQIRFHPDFIYVRHH